MRTYEETHPWIAFQLDLRRAPAALWVMLGECQSKCSHVAGVPLKPAVQQHLQQVYLAKGASATTAIEGNTLTEEQVETHLRGELKLPPSQEYLKQEVDNIIVECNAILRRLVEGGSLEVTPERIAELNTAVLKDLSLAEEVVPGGIRQHRVTVGRYGAAPPQDCEYLLGRLCEWLNSDDFRDDGELRLVMALLRAIVAHVYFVWIHPFADGNGRTARLIEFQILIASGVPAPSAHLLSNHYNTTRAEYYRQLDMASKSGGDLIPFITYAVRGLRDGLQVQLDEIREQQFEVAWHDYVHELFRGRSGPSNERRRNLVLDLSHVKGTSGLFGEVALGDVPTITPRLARAYATRTQKTLTRDINVLVEMSLVARTSAGVRARTEIMRAFLPPTAASRDAAAH